MDDNVFLHDNERLLVHMRPSGALLCSKILWGIVDAALAAFVLVVVFFVVIFFVDSTGALADQYGTIGSVVIALLCLVFAVRRRIKQWKKSSFRVTTDRILVQYKKSIFKDTSKTLKWPQYQESKTGKKTFFDFFFGTKPIVIRYGSADTELFVTVPSLPYATDLKHFLDKVDSANRQNALATIHEFVMKPRGKRDMEDSQDSDRS